MQTQRILVGELQLGQTLNHCVHDGKKSEFDLLLAMLSSDVSDQDQFAFDQHNEQSVASPSLHEQFNVPTSQTLTAVSSEQGEYSLSLSQVAGEEGLLAARLQHCLRPDALNFQADMTHGISNELYGSLSPTVAQRFIKQEHEVEALTVEMDQLILAQQNYEANLVVA